MFLCFKINVIFSAPQNNHQHYCNYHITGNVYLYHYSLLFSVASEFAPVEIYRGELIPKEKQIRILNSKPVAKSGLQARAPHCWSFLLCDWVPTK